MRMWATLQIKKRATRKASGCRDISRQVNKEYIGNPQYGCVEARFWMLKGLGIAHLVKCLQVSSDPLDIGSNPNIHFPFNMIFYGSVKCSSVGKITENLLKGLFYSLFSIHNVIFFFLNNYKANLLILKVILIAKKKWRPQFFIRILVYLTVHFISWNFRLGLFLQMSKNFNHKNYQHTMLKRVKFPWTNIDKK
jgi:hypothetical protein